MTDHQTIRDMARGAALNQADKVRNMLAHHIAYADCEPSSALGEVRQLLGLDMNDCRPPDVLRALDEVLDVPDADDVDTLGKRIARMQTAARASGQSIADTLNDIEKGAPLFADTGSTLEDFKIDPAKLWGPAAPGQPAPPTIDAHLQAFVGHKITAVTGNFGSGHTGTLNSILVDANGAPHSLYLVGDGYTSIVALDGLLAIVRRTEPQVGAG